jgi:hypothetical protein
VVAKIIIKEAVDMILKGYTRIDSRQYVALLNQFQHLRESVERNTGKMETVADRDADGLRAVIGFFFEASMIKRDQREKLWHLIDEIRDENK